MPRLIMASEAQTPDTFHLFSQLPPELRLRIWNLNLPSSRLIPLQSTLDLTSSSFIFFGSKPFAACESDTSLNHQHHQHHQRHSSSKTLPGFSSPAPLPPNLHACSESRAHALRRYIPSLSFARQPGRVLLDPTTDVVYFPSRNGYMASSAQFHTAMSLCRPEELRAMKRLALHEDLFLGGDGGGYGYGYARPNSMYWSGLAVGITVEILRLVRDRMVGVEEIIFVAGKSEEPERLIAQVQTAMRDLANEDGTHPWTPQWLVVTEPDE